MNAQAVSFSYERRPSAILGSTRRPVARVELYSTRFQRWVAYTMVVDTGADFCVFPSSIARDVGLEASRGTRYRIWGVGGQQTTFLHPDVRLRLGSWELIAPVGIVERDDIPPLLGRYQCLDIFALRFVRFVTTFAKPARHPA